MAMETGQNKWTYLALCYNPDLCMCLDAYMQGAGLLTYDLGGDHGKTG